MPGMCEKKCAECGQCIAHQAQGVIDEKNTEIKHLRDLVKAQEELLARYRLGTRRGIDGILDRMTAAKEALNWE